MKTPLFIAAFAALSLSALQAAESAADTKFANDAAIGGLMEVELGKIAEKNATSPQVKEFGAMMVTDHGKANEELKGIAAGKGIQIPAELPKAKQAMVEKLSKVTGEEFDKTYVADMVKDHKKDLAEFQKAAKNLDDPQLKAFAEKGTGMIEHHLQRIEAIQADLNKKK
jgi:putative membrane protein